MGIIMQALMVFFAAYFTVLLLGFQSKLMRDNRWQLSFFMTWLITFAQVATTWSIANNHLGMPLLVFLSGMGGSLGIISSHFLYLWYDKRELDAAHTTDAVNLKLVSSNPTPSTKVG